MGIFLMREQLGLPIISILLLFQRSQVEQKHLIILLEHFVNSKER